MIDISSGKMLVTPLSVSYMFVVLCLLFAVVVCFLVAPSKINYYYLGLHLLGTNCIKHATVFIVVG